jgi:hypothetical protein
MGYLTSISTHQESQKHREACGKMIVRHEDKDIQEEEINTNVADKYYLTFVRVPFSMIFLPISFFHKYLTFYIS